MRELENAIERAIVTCRSRMLTEDDFRFLQKPAMGGDQPWAVPPDWTLQDLEKQAIAAMLERKSGNIKDAAAALGIDRSTLYEKIKKYEIPRQHNQEYRLNLTPADSLSRRRSRD